jgi:serine/threonine protein kinase
MTLSSGTRLGPYEIQSAIGAGGMGEVYKARDTRLDRTVAIKVLPSEGLERPVGDLHGHPRRDRARRRNHHASSRRFFPNGCGFR